MEEVAFQEEVVAVLKKTIEGADVSSLFNSMSSDFICLG